MSSLDFFSLKSGHHEDVPLLVIGERHQRIWKVPVVCSLFSGFVSNKMLGTMLTAVYQSLKKWVFIAPHFCWYSWENRRGKIILLQVMAILSNKQLRLFIICAAGRYNISMFAVKRSHELFKPRPWYCQLPTLWDSLVLIDRTSPLFPWSPNTTTEDK